MAKKKREHGRKWEKPAAEREDLAEGRVTNRISTQAALTPLSGRRTSKKKKKKKEEGKIEGV